MLRVLDFAERFILALLFAQFAIGNLHVHRIDNLLLIASELFSLVFILFRRSTLSVSTQPIDWALALGGTILPLLARPGGAVLAPEWASVGLMSGGAFLAVLAKLSLNRRFGVAPANRGVQRRWIYAFIRHPMYAGYLLLHIGFLSCNASVWNISVYGAAWIVQIARLLREERWLMADPDYRAYVQDVRFRLLPGIF